MNIDFKQMRIDYDSLYEDVTVIKDYTKDYKFLSKDETMIRLEYISPKGFIVNMHWHDWAELLYIEEGKVIIQVDERLYEVETGGLVYIPIGCIHSVNTVEETKLKCFQISSSHLVRVLSDMEQWNVKCCIIRGDLENKSDGHELIGLFQKFFSLFFFTNTIEALGFYSSFYLLIYELSIRSQKGNEIVQIESSRNSLVYDALSIIHNRFKGEITLTSVSDELEITPQHLSRLFKNTLNVSFHKYLTRIGLESATYEVTNTSKTISEILYDSGFPNKQSFIRSFKEKHNMTPSVYRTKTSLM